MDITLRLNLLIIILFAVICGFVIKETIYGRRGMSFEGDGGIRRGAQEQTQQDYGKSFTSKVLSLGSGALEEPSAPPPQDPAAPVTPQTRLFIPHIDQGQTSAAPADTPAKKTAPKWMALPEGFTSETTNDYLIYRESLPITQQLKDYLQNIHGNFVLDVLPFSLTSDFSRIFLMMFRTPDRYSAITRQPQWSAATTDVNNQAVYIMESELFKTNLVHELTHVYFDGFFKPAISPLWMSEGFAVRMQTAVESERDKAWLGDAQQQFRGGRYLVFSDFVAKTDLSDYSSQDAMNWYAQAYSVVDYLLRDKSRDEFYQFSKNLKGGMPLEQAMYRAYGMPFNTVRALEYAWQDSLQHYAPAGGR